ncbi:MAG: class I SAM-dependent methyltransferase [Lachnospiraceae bacterium]|nr:class I SAM-dependent methyltransferase [Lachnospiraceae bacterium]
MCNKLLDYLKSKPEPYKADSEMLWNDEHISKGMLEAHLNPDIDSASRKHEFISESVKWISSLCNTTNHKKLLDLGCGPGIYADKFYDMGFKVTGMDFSQRSIEFAKKAAAVNHKKIEYLCQNYLDIDCDNKFDIITLIYCDFGVLKSKDRELLLLKIRRALKPDGKLVLDGFTKNNYNNFVESQKIVYEDSGYWSPTPYACIERTFIYNEASLFLEQYIVLTETTCRCYNNWNCTFEREPLCTELEKAGFTKMQFYSDVAGKEFSENSETICVVAS